MNPKNSQLKQNKATHNNNNNKKRRRTNERRIVRARFCLKTQNIPTIIKLTTTKSTKTHPEHFPGLIINFFCNYIYMFIF